jgi:hypothetical protein
VAALQIVELLLREGVERLHDDLAYHNRLNARQGHSREMPNGGRRQQNQRTAGLVRGRP